MFSNFTYSELLILRKALQQSSTVQSEAKRLLGRCQDELAARKYSSVFQQTKGIAPKAIPGVMS